MIAECYDCIALSQLPTVGGGKGGAVVRAGRLGRVTTGGRSPGEWCIVGASMEGGGRRDAEVWWFTGGVRRRRAGAVITECSHCIVLSP